MEKISVNTGAFDAVMQASPVVQFTLLILVGLSITCWGIAFNKWKLFKKIKLMNELFLVQFWKSSSLDHLNDELDKFRDSPLARVFKSSYLEMKKLADMSSHLTSLIQSQAPHGTTPTHSATPSQNDPQRPQLTSIDNLERVVRKATENELAKMEAKLNVLATTGSTGPFIGLFGTVWGIMSSFQKIGATGNASLAVVAPGISEALIATAIGLAAAIPAVVLYNHFVSQVRKEEIELNNFSADFLNIVKRNFFNQ
ncbi:MAG: MotA/TolQ/ExbB proton channel family protein [Bdellovibrionaceae bacterium]|nr:MotA/TolQ/ExbB proton channel family protein [Pseudobdellovibrionaceae bacterium]